MPVESIAVAAQSVTERRQVAVRHGAVRDVGVRPAGALQKSQRLFLVVESGGHCAAVEIRRSAGLHGIAQFEPPVGLPESFEIGRRRRGI